MTTARRIVVDMPQIALTPIPSPQGEPHDVAEQQAVDLPGPDQITWLGWAA